MVPKGKIIVYHYIDAFSWNLFNGEKEIRVKLVEPHNLLSSIVTVCSWIRPDDYDNVSNLGRETLQQLSSLKSVYHTLLKKNIEVIVRRVMQMAVSGGRSLEVILPAPLIQFLSHWNITNNLGT